MDKREQAIWLTFALTTFLWVGLFSYIIGVISRNYEMKLDKYNAIEVSEDMEDYLLTYTEQEPLLRSSMTEKEILWAEALVLEEKMVKGIRGETTPHIVYYSNE